MVSPTKTVSAMSLFCVCMIIPSLFNINIKCEHEFQDYFYDNWYILGIYLEIILLLEYKEYHELCAHKWDGKITAMMNSEKVPELSTSYIQNKDPSNFSHLRALISTIHSKPLHTLLYKRHICQISNLESWQRTNCLETRKLKFS